MGAVSVPPKGFISNEPVRACFYGLREPRRQAADCHYPFTRWDTLIRHFQTPSSGSLIDDQVGLLRPCNLLDLLSCLDPGERLSLADQYRRQSSPAASAISAMSSPCSRSLLGHVQ